MEKGFVKYSDYIEKKGYSQEMEFRKIMLNELLAAFFIEYLTLFISFWEREYKYADAYIYLIKEGYPFSFKVGKNEVIENFLTFHPFVFGVWGMEYELVKKRYFIVYLRGEGEVYS
ncbi:MAG: hypothetical protein N3D73_03075, partial [Candidatus Diapherotrites archaeon]|nr:hypothetical protein [Candidatus Diapherotrites archaeon]